jgi:Bacteriocin-protection, YdeI or OmpD-Associated/Domain of unknown function (DUF1905)
VADRGEQRFSAVLTEADRGGGRWIEVPFDARATFGEARAPVAGTVNGVALHSRLAVYGGRTYLGLTREVRDAATTEVGDEVEVLLRRDDAPRVVTPPRELEQALAAAADASDRFEALSYTHRREYAQWVGQAKRAETRARRAARAVEMLRDGTRHP